MAGIYTEDFPFIEIRKDSGDYLDNLSQIWDRGYVLSQAWSVVITDTDEGNMVFTYGPADHYINRVGFVVTQEHHDGDTYYEEIVIMSGEDDETGDKQKRVL